MNSSWKIQPRRADGLAAMALGCFAGLVTPPIYVAAVAATAFCVHCGTWRAE
jgi:hypothetical protein